MSNDKRLERIEVKLDDLSDHLASIDITLGAQHISLKEHIRRTTLIEQELRPIKKHVDMIKGGAALLGIILTISAIVAYIVGWVK
jgi:hypothetical protein